MQIMSKFFLLTFSYVKLHSSRLLHFSLIKPVEQRSTAFRNLTLLLLSKHGYQATPVSLKIVQVTDTIHLPAASLLPLDAHMLIFCSHQQAYPEHIYKNELCHTMVNHILC